MPKLSIPATAEGLPKTTQPMAAAIRRFVRRCSAAITAFRYAGNWPEYLVTYERTGFEGDDDGNPSYCSGLGGIDATVNTFADVTLRHIRAAGGECNRPRLVMVLGHLDIGKCPSVPQDAAANA